MQCRVQKNFGDNVFSRGSGLSSIPAKFYWQFFHTFRHFILAVKDILLNRTQGSSLLTCEIYETATILFFSSTFLGTFLGAHNVWTLSFSVWLRTWFDMHIKSTMAKVNQDFGSRWMYIEMEIFLDSPRD